MCNEVRTFPQNIKDSQVWTEHSMHFWMGNIWAGKSEIRKFSGYPAGGFLIFRPCITDHDTCSQRNCISREFTSGSPATFNSWLTQKWRRFSSCARRKNYWYSELSVHNHHLPKYHHPNTPSPTSNLFLPIPTTHSYLLISFNFINLSNYPPTNLTPT